MRVRIQGSGQGRGGHRQVADAKVGVNRGWVNRQSTHRQLCKMAKQAAAGKEGMLWSCNLPHLYPVGPAGWRVPPLALRHPLKGRRARGGQGERKGHTACTQHDQWSEQQQASVQAAPHCTRNCAVLLTLAHAEAKLAQVRAQVPTSKGTQPDGPLHPVLCLLHCGPQPQVHHVSVGVGL